MKLKVFTLPSVLFLSITIFIASCAKDGATGPAGTTGPAGPQGTPGVAGAAGAAGVAGAPGTANVIYSDWLNIKFAPNTDSSVWTGNITAAKLVDSILNKGDIKVYLNAGSDSTNDQFIVTLPIYDAFAVGAIINPYFSPQTITLAATGDVSSDSLRGFHYFQYRYILIPGGIKGGRPVVNGGTNTGINWNDYNQVKKYLNLKD